MEILLQILFVFIILFLIVTIYGICKFITILNDYKYIFEDEIEIPSFINIDSNIINTDAITNIARIYDNNGVSYRLLIETIVYATIDKKEPIIFSFDTSDECRNVFDKLNDILDSRIIVVN